MSERDEVRVLDGDCADRLRQRALGVVEHDEDVTERPVEELEPDVKQPRPRRAVVLHERAFRNIQVLNEQFTWHRISFVWNSLSGSVTWRRASGLRRVVVARHSDQEPVEPAVGEDLALAAGNGLA